MIVSVIERLRHHLYQKFRNPLYANHDSRVDAVLSNVYFTRKMNEIKIIKQISCSLLLTAGSNEQNHDIPDLLDQYLPVESIPEFSLGSEIYNLGSAYIVPNNQRESHRDRDKSGKWTPEEENYSNRLVNEFMMGSLNDCCEGMTLRSYVSEKLGCTPMRVSKKYAGQGIGKTLYEKKSQLYNIFHDQPSIEALRELYLQSVQRRAQKSRDLAAKNQLSTSEHGLISKRSISPTSSVPCYTNLPWQITGLITEHDELDISTHSEGYLRSNANKSLRSLESSKNLIDSNSYHDVDKNLFVGATPRFRLFKHTTKAKSKRPTRISENCDDSQLYPSIQFSKSAHEYSEEVDTPIHLETFLPNQSLKKCFQPSHFVDELGCSTHSEGHRPLFQNSFADWNRYRDIDELDNSSHSTGSRNYLTDDLGNSVHSESGQLPFVNKSIQWSYREKDELDQSHHSDGFSLAMANASLLVSKYADDFCNSTHSSDGITTVSAYSNMTTSSLGTLSSNSANDQNMSGIKFTNYSMASLGQSLSSDEISQNASLDLKINIDNSEMLESVKPYDDIDSEWLEVLSMLVPPNTCDGTAVTLT